ncbi:hypothetical protein J6590_026585 [Homalodisca vitripennis]|nr:hypothetical protein J6590_026585 [Homalodisca vitripennis]
MPLHKYYNKQSGQLRRCKHHNNTANIIFTAVVILPHCSQVELSDLSAASSAVSVVSERTKAIRDQYYFERRLLFFCTILVGVAIIVWAISISTNFWFIIDGGDGIWINETKRYFLKSHSGLFKLCRTFGRKSILQRPKIVEYFTRHCQKTKRGSSVEETPQLMNRPCYTLEEFLEACREEWSFEDTS